MNTVYFDNAATTMLCTAAKNEILRVMDIYGNPSSLYSLGLESQKLISSARDKIRASLCITNPRDKIIFTAGGSEANNLALIGVAQAKKSFAGKKIITSSSEHPSVLASVDFLSSYGFEVVKIPTKNGIFDEQAFLSSVDKNTFLVSVMMTNNETGAINDISGLCKKAKAINPDLFFHTDCVQSYMKKRINASKLGVDMISVSAHKIGAPKGVGALYVAERVLRSKSILPIIHGGGQEDNMRAGTENIIGICAFGAAAEYKSSQISSDHEKTAALYSYIKEKLNNDSRFCNVKINTPLCESVSPSIISIRLPNIKSEVMLHFLSERGVFVSSGSACSSKSTKSSHVLTAFGLTPLEADCSMRVSLCAENTVGEADLFLSALSDGLSSIIRIH